MVLQRTFKSSPQLKITGLLTSPHFYHPWERLRSFYVKLMVMMAEETLINFKHL